MKESEARKKKWCHERSKAAAARGHDPFGEDANCIGSDCMMWRSSGGHWECPDDADSHIFRTPEEGGCTYNPEGYCGLGGKP